MLDQTLFALKHNLQHQIALFADSSERLQTLCSLWAEYPHKWEAVLDSLCDRAQQMRQLAADCARIKQEAAAALGIGNGNVPLSSLLCRVPKSERQILHDLYQQWQDGKRNMEMMLQRARKLLACHSSLNRQWQEICTLTAGTYDGRGRVHTDYARAAVDCRY